jgi:hypothetical protein
MFSPILLGYYIYAFGITSKLDINKTKVKFLKKISNQLALNRIFLRNVLLLPT